MLGASLVGAFAVARLASGAVSAAFVTAALGSRRGRAPVSSRCVGRRGRSAACGGEFSVLGSPRATRHGVLSIARVFRPLRRSLQAAHGPAGRLPPPPRPYPGYRRPLCVGRRVWPVSPVAPSGPAIRPCPWSRQVVSWCARRSSFPRQEPPWPDSSSERSGSWCSAGNHGPALRTSFAVAAVVSRDSGPDHAVDGHRIRLGRGVPRRPHRPRSHPFGTVARQRPHRDGDPGCGRRPLRGADRPSPPTGRSPR